LKNEVLKEKYFLEFIKFEMKYKNYDKCRMLFKYGLENIKNDNKNKLTEFYEKFEKMHGTKETLEDMIIKKRKLYYESELEKNNMNYDFWFDYLKLEEEYGNKESIRDSYEKAISNVPPINEKKYWRRYIYLWINYAFYEELINKDNDRTGEIYQNLLKLIPHNIFTFGKIWILYAEYYIRNKNLDKARNNITVTIFSLTKLIMLITRIKKLETFIKEKKCK
jgi:crooked neck